MFRSESNVRITLILRQRSGPDIQIGLSHWSLNMIWISWRTAGHVKTALSSNTRT